MSAAAALFLGVMGLIVGSFLNVCIYRLPRRQSLNWPGSRCTSCERALSWYENIPFVSWIVLRGRCRTCGAGISVMYPLVELVTGALFVAGYAIYGWTPLLAVRLAFACAMVVLFAVDLRHHILPNVITVPGIVIGLLVSLFLPEPGWRSSLIGLIAGGGVLFAIAEAYYRFRGVEGLGMGDVKMLSMIGAFLGWELMLVTLILASFAGSIIGVGVIAMGRGGMKAALPFGTFLAVGALTAAVAGDALVDWYIGFYR
ncbi:MAG TPA: prepilin peptidase [Vicinamibacterales bacterium]|nr:prepilin peptidase [Vicinamibacterales bacterium]